MTNVHRIAKQFNLKPKEILFLHEHLVNQKSITDAYRSVKKIKPTTLPGSVRRTASRFYSNIKEKIDLTELLELSGKGPDRVFLELEGKLQAKMLKDIWDETKDADGNPMAIRKTIEVDDNTTQTRALELLSDILNLRKHEANINLNHSGSVRVHFDAIIYEAVHGNADGRAGGNGDGKPKLAPANLDN